jgi:2,3-bisphosphoglycerate-independent phosphoglycerate mutase
LNSLTHLLSSALKGLILGEGTPTEDPVQAIKDVYAQGGSKDADEFLKPIIVGGDERRIKGELIL